MGRELREPTSVSVSSGGIFSQSPGLVEQQRDCHRESVFQPFFPQHAAELVLPTRKFAPPCASDLAPGEITF